MKDYIAIVSGAASGLGNAVMHDLAAKETPVAAVDLNAIAADDLPEGCVSFACDVSDAGAVNATVADIAKSMGKIGVLVNCAGIAPGAKIVGRNGQHDPAMFAKVLAVNTIGTFNLMTATAAHMQKQDPDDIGQRGVIIMTASVAAFEAQIGQIAYAASKGAVAAMTLPAARELARDGIRVVTIAPGVFATPMMLNMPQEVQDSIGATIPFPPRLSDPADYASLVGHIIENSTLNGEVIRLDGALRMAAR